MFKIVEVVNADVLKQILQIVNHTESDTQFIFSVRFSHLF
jgi:hypothetical protein